jgi:hypothetical protein
MGNGYTYVGNNPQSFVDPFGLKNYFFAGFVSDQQDAKNDAIRQLGYDIYDSYTSNAELANIEAGIQYGYATGDTIDQSGQVLKYTKANLHIKVG